MSTDASRGWLRAAAPFGLVAVAVALAACGRNGDGAEDNAAAAGARQAVMTVTATPPR